MHRRSKILVTGAVVGGAMTLVTWLLNSGNWHSPTIDEALTLLSLPAIFLGIVVSGNVHQPSEAAVYLAIFIEWGVVGAGLAWAVLRKSKLQRGGSR